MKRHLKVVRLKKPKANVDHKFIETLVWALDLARRGELHGYASVFILEDKEAERMRTIEIAAVFDKAPPTKLQLLGGMRRMEHNFMVREWPDD